MQKKTNRRSISLRRPVYDRLKTHCGENNISLSRFIEERVDDYFKAERPAVKETRSA